MSKGRVAALVTIEEMAQNAWTDSLYGPHPEAPLKGKAKAPEHVRAIFADRKAERAIAAVPRRAPASPSSAVSLAAARELGWPPEAQPAPCPRGCRPTVLYPDYMLAVDGAPERTGVDKRDRNRSALLARIGAPLGAPPEGEHEAPYCCDSRLLEQGYYVVRVLGPAPIDGLRVRAALRYARALRGRSYAAGVFAGRLIVAPDDEFETNARALYRLGQLEHLASVAAVSLDLAERRRRAAVHRLCETESLAHRTRVSELEALLSDDSADPPRPAIVYRTALELEADLADARRRLELAAAGAAPAGSLLWSDPEPITTYERLWKSRMDSYRADRELAARAAALDADLAACSARLGTGKPAP